MPTTEVPEVSKLCSLRVDQVDMGGNNISDNVASPENATIIQWQNKVM